MRTKIVIDKARKTYNIHSPVSCMCSTVQRKCIHAAHIRPLIVIAPTGHCVCSYDDQTADFSSSLTAAKML